MNKERVRPTEIGNTLVVGAAGFEPTDAGVKYAIPWLGVWDSNPECGNQNPVP